MLLNTQSYFQLIFYKYNNLITKAIKFTISYDLSIMELFYFAFYIVIYKIFQMLIFKFFKSDQENFVVK